MKLKNMAVLAGLLVLGASAVYLKLDEPWRSPKENQMLRDAINDDVIGRVISIIVTDDRRGSMLVATEQGLFRGDMEGNWRMIPESDAHGRITAMAYKFPLVAVATEQGVFLYQPQYKTDWSKVKGSDGFGSISGLAIGRDDRNIVIGTEKGVFQTGYDTMDWVSLPRQFSRPPKSLVK